ncbi:MAG TPA: PilZ domain-containing protein [Allosphingosinicella sp.]|nr:PilZ domain-containing protein [Allosphingosinicella sp.]
MRLQQKSGFGKVRTPKAAIAAAAAGATDTARGISCYRVGKIATGAGQALCIVRMISPFVIALDIEVAFSGAEQASLVIGKEEIGGALAMLGGKRAELRPARAVDPEAILADPSMLAGVGRRALPRVDVDVRARLEVMGQGMTARICDISTDGVKVLVDDLLCMGDRVTIVMRGLSSRLVGQVRWCEGDHAGIAFDQPLAIGQLNQWLASQSAPADQPDWSLVSRS